MQDTSASATILVVDDEESVAESYSLRLGLQYDDVHTATGGHEALEFLETTDVDVVLLDRRMPELSGDEVVAEIRDREYDCRVIMVTAVEPDFDVLEMPFDDYLQKPVEKEDMFAAIEQQVTAAEYDEKLSEFFRVRSKIAVLEAEKPPERLEDNKKYQRLKEREATLDNSLEGTVDQFDDMTRAFEEIGRS